MSLLVLDNVSIGINGADIIRGLSLVVNSKEAVAIQSPSGFGKTTLLRAIQGLIDPTAGQITLNGKTAAEIGWPEFRAQVLFVSQQPALHDETVEENLRAPFDYNATKGYYSHERTIEFLERLRLSSSILYQKATSLSVGEQQRICVIRAMLLAPKVMLFDEPTSALDDEATKCVESLILEWIEENDAAALIVTHSKAQAERLTSRILDLSQYRADKSMEKTHPLSEKAQS